MIPDDSTRLFILSGSSHLEIVRQRFPLHLLHTDYQRQNPRMSGELVTRKEVTEYLSLFPQLVLEMLDAVEDVGVIQQWVGRVLYRNVPNNEVLHGLATAVALKQLVPNPQPALVKDAHVLGWCLQMVNY